MLKGKLHAQRKVACSKESCVQGLNVQNNCHNQQLAGNTIYHSNKTLLCSRVGDPTIQTQSHSSLFNPTFPFQSHIYYPTTTLLVYTQQMCYWSLWNIEAHQRFKKCSMSALGGLGITAKRRSSLHQSPLGRLLCFIYTQSICWCLALQKCPLLRCWIKLGYNRSRGSGSASLSKQFWTKIPIQAT